MQEIVVAQKEGYGRYWRIPKRYTIL